MALNFFADYNSITVTQATAAHGLRVDDRAVQNSRALYRCLKASITGDLRTTVFDQFANVPNHEDGPTLFLTLTSFTMASAIQLSMIASKNILEFDPAEHRFHIPTINTQLNHLFVLATTANRTLHNSERLQHIITVYSRIKQPESWAQWVRIQIDRIEDGTVTVPQDFMNSAALKYTKISTTDSGFQGSSNTLQEDIVAMLATAKRKASKASTSPADPKAAGKPTAAPSDKGPEPPFIRHFKESDSPDARRYQLGDTKSWNGTTYHYCDCPNHRRKIKWHTHPPDQCRTRARWLETKDSTPSAANPASAHLATGSAGVPADIHDDATAPTVASSITDRSDVTALLAHALSRISDNDLARDLVGDALNAINDHE